MIEESAQQHAEKTALIWYSEGMQQEMNYAEFWQRVQEFALGLEKLGIRQQSKVGILSHNNPCWPICDLAILSLGAISIPIDPYLPPYQAMKLMDQFDVEYIVAETAENAELFHQIPTYKKNLIAIYDDDKPEQNIYSFTTVLNQGADLSELKEQKSNAPLLRDTDLATIVHTPGTNAPPKGVMLTHQNLSFGVHSLFNIFPASKHDIFLPLLSLSHPAQRIVQTLYPLAVGATIVFREENDSLVETLQKTQPTILFAVPRLLSELQAEMEEQFHEASWVKKKVYNWALQVGVEREEYLKKGFNWQLPTKLRERYEQADLWVFSKLRELIGGKLRFLICTGGKLSEKQREYFSYCGLPVIYCYHMTECTTFVAAQSLLHPYQETVGFALPSVETKVLTDGELVIQSPTVMMGYYKAPEKTTEALIDGWLQTGDHVSINKQNQLQIQPSPRLMMLLANGQSFSPEEIESALEESKYISQAFIMGHMQKSTTLLFVPDLEAIYEYAKDEDFPSSRLDDLMRSSLIQHLIKREIAHCCEKFPISVHPTSFYFLDHSFSIETGTLTSIGKRRRWLIEATYYQELENIAQ